MRRSIAAGTLLISAILLFAGLGHYALWDDEAVTALAADGVWRTGDTSVLLDHNIVAYRSGLLLKGTKERSTPPLGAYFAAPFLGIFGHSALVARLPFAFVGLLSVGMMLWWLKTVDAKWITYLLLGLAIIGNVSFQLYSRQCRYYSPAIFSSIVIAYLYLNWNGKRWQLVLMAVAGLVLLGSNYLNYLALHVCMLLDYLIIGRKRKWLAWLDWVIVLAPQVVLGSIIVLIWNTLGTGNRDYLLGNSLLQRFQLVWMNLRDIFACEFGVGLLVLAAPLIWIVLLLSRRENDSWLVRAPLILVAYVTVISMLSPQTLPAQGSVDADVRYIAAAIPLCLAIGLITLKQVSRVSVPLAIGIGLLACFSNALHLNWMGRSPFRSTIGLRIAELVNPPADPYTPAAAWINAYLHPGDSVWVMPDHMPYPLMFHAPKVVYAWQFIGDAPAAMKGQPPIHFMNSGVFPDYAIAFGPVANDVMDYFRTRGVTYQLIQHLDYFPIDTYRPELFWRSFRPQASDWQRGLAIYIFRRTPSAAAAAGRQP